MPVAYNKLPKIAAAAAPLVEAALAKTAFDIEGLAKNLAPVGETGNLMNSIGAAREKALTWRVTANAEYAIYVEMGTRRMAAQPYLDPALREGSKSLTAMLGKIV